MTLRPEMKMTRFDLDPIWPFRACVKVLLQETCKNGIYLKCDISTTYTIFTILFS